CPVRWFPQSGLFMCPCHGGAYYRDGSRASGPPERGLFEYPIKVQDGVITIQACELPTPEPTAPLGTEQPLRRVWSSLTSGSITDCSSRLRFGMPPNLPCRETRRAGGTSSAARRSPCFCCSSPPGFCSRWSTCRRRARRGTACRRSITKWHLAGSSAPCTDGD